MMKWQNPLIFLIITILCLGSLATEGIFQPEFDLTEFDEEILTAAIAGVMITNQFFSRYQSMHLNCRSASLLPASPPPKYS